MNISSFSSAVGSFKTLQKDLGVKFDKAVVTLKDKELTLEKPLKPPSRWTTFLGALSNNKMVGQWQSVKAAKETCDTYSVQSADYVLSNNSVRAGFVKALHTKHGNLTSLCTLPPLNGKPLSAKTVATTIATMEKASKNCVAQNNKRLHTIVDAFVEKSVKNDDKQLEKESKKFLKENVMANCKKLDNYTQGAVSIKEVMAETEKAIPLLSIFQELQTLPFISLERRERLSHEASEKILPNADKNQAKESVQPTIDKAIKESIRNHLRSENLSAIADAYFTKIDTAKTENAPGIKAVIESVVTSLLENLSEKSIEDIRQVLNCQPNSRTLEVMTSVNKKISDAVDQAVKESNTQHFQSLAQLNTASCTLNEKQKNYLREVGEQRPLRLDLIKRSESLAAAISRETTGTGITAEQQITVFKQICELPAPERALTQALILTRTGSMLNDNDPTSTLRQVALEKGVPQAVLPTLHHAMLEHIKIGNTSASPQTFRETELALAKQIDTVLNQHVAAMAATKASSTLTTHQKDMLHEIGQRMPLNPVQIKQYEALSVALKSPTPSESKAQAAESSQHLALRTLEDAVNTTQQNAREQWMASSVGVSDKNTYALIQQLTSVAVAGLSREEASAALKNLNSSTSLAANSQLVSTSPIAVWRPAMHNTLRASLKQDQDAEPASNSPLSASDFARQPAKTDKDIPNQQLSMMLTKQGEMDERGVTLEARMTSSVAASFDAGKIFSTTKEEILNYVEADERMDNGLSKTMDKDITRAMFSINGEHINAALMSGERNTPALAATIKQTFHDKLKGGGASTETMEAISLCMNQKGINRFSEACSVEAIQGALATEKTSLQHETWQQADGSWLVRSSYSYKPAVISKESGSIPIEGDGIGIYALTYRVTPQAEGVPSHIALEGYTCAFDF